MISLRLGPTLVVLIILLQYSQGQLQPTPALNTLSIAAFLQPPANVVHQHFHGRAPSLAELQSLVQASDSHLAKGGKKTFGGDGVMEDNNGGKKAAGTPSFVLPLASPMNKPEVVYIPPWSFGNEKWDPVAGAARPFGPSPDFKNSMLKPEQSVPFPPGTPPDQNPNMYIQPPPSGVNPSALQLSEDFVVNHVRIPEEAGPQGTLNDIPVFPRRLPPHTTLYMGKKKKSGSFLQVEQTVLSLSLVSDCINCHYV